MALYDEANGLLGTHVTWDDVENEIQKSLGPNAKFGQNKTIADISEGYGFLSHVAIIDPDWQSASVNELPTKLAVKILTMAQAGGLSFIKKEKTSECEIDFKKIHNREVQVYDKLKELNNPNVPSLKIFCTVPFTEENRSKGFIIMEAVDNIANIHADINIDDKLIEQILEAIASFHSLTWDFAAEEESLTCNLYADVWALMFDKEFIANYMTHYRRLLGDDKILKELEAAALEMDHKYRRLVDTTSERTGMRRMLCHGDFWSSNMLFTQNNEGLLRLKSLIDFQLVNFGCVGQDLSRMMSSMLTKEQRDNKGKYLKIYYKHLTRFVGDRPMPFTMEQLTASVDVYMGPAAFEISKGISMLATQTIARRKEEDRETARLAIAERVRGLIIDMLENHQRNMKTFAILK